MIAYIRARGANRAPIGRSTPCLGAHEALVDLLGHEIGTDLFVELAQEPVQEASHLDAAFEVLRQQSPAAERRAAGLVQIGRDGARAGNREPALFDEDRNVSGGVEREERETALPRPLLDEFRLDGHFGERQTDETGLWAERIMVEEDHPGPLTRYGRRE